MSEAIQKWLEMGTNMAAVSAGIRFSQRKNATIIIIEIIRGARTIGDVHPLDEPEVKENINKINATTSYDVNGSGKMINTWVHILVKVDTPTRSRLLNLAKPFSFGASLVALLSRGMRMKPMEAMGTVNSARNQKVQCHDAYWMKMAPTKSPKTEGNLIKKML